MNKTSVIDREKQLLPHFIITDILMYAVSTSVLVVNGGIVIIFLAQRLRRSSPISPAGLLVLNLLIADALVGCLGIYVTASFYEGVCTTVYGCITRVSMRFLFKMGSHMALINVAIDRYIAIMHTLHYREWVTTERSLALIGFGWFAPLCGVIYLHSGIDWTREVVLCSEIKTFSIFIVYINIPSHLAALISVVVIQCRIYFQLRKYERTHTAEAHHVLRRYSHKSARALFWVTTTYVVCWLPFDAMLLVILFIPQQSLKIVFDGTVILAHSSFLVNAYVFSYNTENIRKPVSVLCVDVWRFVICRREGLVRAKQAVRAAIVNNCSVRKRSSSADTTTSASQTTTSTVSNSVSPQLKGPTSAMELHV